MASRKLLKKWRQHEEIKWDLLAYQSTSKCTNKLHAATAKPENLLQQPNSLFGGSITSDNLHLHSAWQRLPLAESSSLALLSSLLHFRSWRRHLFAFTILIQVTGIFCIWQFESLLNLWCTSWITLKFIRKFEWIAEALLTGLDIIERTWHVLVIIFMSKFGCNPSVDLPTVVYNSATDLKLDSTFE